jgi:hypothetical protein
MFGIGPAELVILLFIAGLFIGVPVIVLVVILATQKKRPREDDGT